jgi:hypothetical protein
VASRATIADVVKLRTVCSIVGCPELAEPGRGQCAAHVRPSLGRPHRRERAKALKRASEERGLAANGGELRRLERGA